VVSVGSLLTGLALAMVSAAYVARPFRPAAGSSSEEEIDAWVAKARRQPQDAALFCTGCGRRTSPEDRFCAGCGTPLGERQ
jgi:hypothetical protein